MENEDRVMAREKLDRELRYFRIAGKGISLRALEKVAEAMDCKLVYAIVPRGGKTLMELAEQRRWSKKLGKS